MLDCLVVGGGLFGSTIAAALERQAGMTTMIVDDGRPMAGSRPAACLMKPSWFSGMPKTEATASIALLSQLFEVSTIQFRIEPGPLTTGIYWVPPRKILDWAGKHDRMRATVRKLVPIRDGSRSWLAEYDNVVGGRGTLEARSVILATGVWASQLRPVPGLEGREGVAFLWRYQEAALFQAKMLPGVPNPYRQVVAFDRGDGLWAADGMAVKRMSDDVIRASRERCADFAGLPSKTCTVLTGTRPYMKTDGPAHLEEREPNLWIATGGAKNGTIAAAWCALRLVRHYGG